MAGQRPFNPGVSLAGAVDLEALKHQANRGRLEALRPQAVM